MRDMADKSVQFDGCTEDSSDARPLGRQSLFPFLLSFKVISDVLEPFKKNNQKCLKKAFIQIR